jgi:hypothetical protein
MRSNAASEQQVGGFFKPEPNQVSARLKQLLLRPCQTLKLKVLSTRTGTAVAELTKKLFKKL